MNKQINVTLETKNTNFGKSMSCHGSKHLPKPSPQRTRRTREEQVQTFLKIFLPIQPPNRLKKTKNWPKISCKSYTNKINTHTGPKSTTKLKNKENPKTLFGFLQEHQEVPKTLEDFS